MAVEEGSHPKMETLLEYFAGELPDSAEAAVELHMSDCDACAELSEQVFLLDEVWREWNARRHGQLHLQITLARALAKAEVQTTNPEWRERLHQWRRLWTGHAEAALRTVLATSAGVARTVAEGLDSLTRPGGSWHFGPEPSPAPIWGDDDHEDRESTILATATLSADTPRALVELKGGDQGEIVVRVDNLPAGGMAPLVVLIAVSPQLDVLVRVAEVTLHLGTGSHFARFSKLPPGEYIVAFEPTGAAPGA
jgi:hypothetical protein